MCISRCGVVATVRDGALTQVNADPAHPNGCICVKGTAAPEIVYSKDRLRYPLRRTRPKGDPDPGWVAISWDEAMTQIASRLQDVKTRYGAEAVVFGFGTPSGGSTMDTARWLERLANAFGTPNIMASIHICNWNRVYGSQYTYGVSTPPPDYENSRCILLWGFNPRASWPTVATRIGKAKTRGAKLIVIDPRRTTIAEKADLWLRVRPGYDGVLALAMIHVLVEEGLYDEPFVRDWTNGPLLVRDDDHSLLSERDLKATGQAETFFAYDNAKARLAPYQGDLGYGDKNVVLSLLGNYAVTLADGKTVSCRPAFERLKEVAAQYCPEKSESMTGIAAAEVRQAARLFASEKPSCYTSWAGLEQHSDAAQTNRAVCLFYTLTGQFDQRGSNFFYPSTPTHSILGQEFMPKEIASRRLGYSERPLGPPGLGGRVQSYDVYRAIVTAKPYPVKALITFGSDPLLGNGDSATGKAALEALDFFVHVDMFANPSAVFADFLLPAATCWEREALMPSFPTAADTATWVQLKPAVIQPLFESRSDLEIIFDLAARLGLGDYFFDGAIDAALNYQLAPCRITVEQLRANPRGLRADSNVRYQKYAEIDPRTGQPRGFSTPTRRIEIFSTSFARAGYAPLPKFAPGSASHDDKADVAADYPLFLTSFRLMQFCDQQHRNIPRLRRQAREPFVEIHPHTAAALNLKDSEWVRLQTVAGEVRLKTRFNTSLDPQVVATQYGWWQKCDELKLPGYDPFAATGANVNLIIPNDGIDPISGSVPHRSRRCRVVKETGTPRTGKSRR